MPAAAVVVGEECVGCFIHTRILAVERLGKDTDISARVVLRWRMGCGVDAILSREEHGPCREHDSRVVEYPVVVKFGKVMDGLLHKWMPLGSEHKVVGYADRYGLWKYDVVLEQGIHPTHAANVEVHIYTAVVVKDKVSDSVCTLNRICVTVIRIQEPWVMLLDEST